MAGPHFAPVYVGDGVFHWRLSLVGYGLFGLSGLLVTVWLLGLGLGTVSGLKGPPDEHVCEHCRGGKCVNYGQNEWVHAENS